VSHTPSIPWLDETPKVLRLLVGVSGGADSVSLLHLLKEAGFRDLVVCHLNHGLRGEESDGDEAFVANLAAELGYPSEIARAEVAALAAKAGKSVETTARESRHAFFADCAEKYGCRRVLLAHHADDQAETALWNLLRGSHGLKGMRSPHIITVGDVQLELIRPLLSLRREELRGYLQRRHLPWREDSTNSEAFAIRNRIRNEAVPLLSEITGRDIVPSLVNAIDSNRDHDAILSWALDQAHVLDPQGRLHVPALRALPSALQRAAIFRYLRIHHIPDLDRDLTNRAVDLLDPQGPTATINLPGGKQLRRREGRMLIE
jgi:tRNA(Ile)-lysidine synthase